MLEKSLEPRANDHNTTSEDKEKSFDNNGDHVRLEQTTNMSISAYYKKYIGNDAFLKEHGTGQKARAYVTCLNKLRPINQPEDLKNYPDIRAIRADQDKNKYLTQNHGQAIKHFFTFIKKYHGLDEFNGCKLTQWEAFYPDMNKQYGNNKDKEKSMSGHNPEVETEDLKKWTEFIDPVMMPYYLLLCYSGARETHLYAALSDPNKKIEHIGGSNAKGKFKNIQREILFLDATGTVEEGGKSKKLEFGFMFPLELENVIKSYISPFTSSYGRKKQFTAPRKWHLAGKPELMKVGAANTRKWNLNIMAESEHITSEEMDNIQGRGLGDVQSTAYRDMKYKVCNAYAKVLPVIEKALPIPDWITNYDPGVLNQLMHKDQTEEARNVTGKDKIGIDKRFEIISLKDKGYSQRKIAEITGCARNTVSDVLKKANS
ncbi:MAG: helix-turn-helix domain-containing protein [Methanomicrobium sp.]|nr:helix-turn-helix domain-containing protein [Methanomicrobium sp.]